MMTLQSCTSIIFYSNLMIIAPLRKKVTFLWYKLFPYKHYDGQCFENFFAELKNLSKEWEFSNLLKSLIRDMVVTRITDNI